MAERMGIEPTSASRRSQLSGLLDVPACRPLRYGSGSGIRTPICSSKGCRPAVERTRIERLVRATGLEPARPRRPQGSGPCASAFHHARTFGGAGRSRTYKGSSPDRFTAGPRPVRVYVAVELVRAGRVERPNTWPSTRRICQFSYARESQSFTSSGKWPWLARPAIDASLLNSSRDASVPPVKIQSPLGSFRACIGGPSRPAASNSFAMSRQN